MTITVPQIPLALNSWTLAKGTPSFSKCSSIWDTTLARFSPCFLPTITTIPAMVGALVLLSYSLRLLNVYRPRWTKPFIVESKENSDDLPTTTHRPSYATYALLVISLIGMLTQVATMFFPYRQFTAIYPSIAWGMAFVLALIERPRTASISHLVIFATLLFAQLVVLSHLRMAPTAKDIPLVLSPAIALTGIFIILNTPLRDPALPYQDISPVFSTPTVKLRTPEDSLTPWQYMSVSWMAPLIQKGVTTQLDDTDVWDLGYEFKHARLHSAFRKLRGSVTNKLLQANGMDLIRTTTLSLVQLFATLLTPVLLQRLLNSMKEEASPRSATITYAFLSVVLRLLAAQCGIFTTWYSRRAYERSRGEMITMLYEKTMNRKIIGAKQPEASQSSPAINGDSNGHATAGGQEEANGLTQKDKSWASHALRLLQNIWFYLRTMFTKKTKAANKPEDEAASTGKILNLMRNDVYEVSQRLWDFPDLITKPTGVIFATLLIWRMLGWSCLLGVFALFASQLINVLIVRFKIIFEKKRRVATDEKLKRITQFIESIRHLRWYGWQNAWLQDIMESRQKELHLRIIQAFFSTTLSFILRFGSGAFPAVAFYAFTTMAGKPLRVDLIFPAMDLFALLESYLRALPTLLDTMLNAYVAIGRIETFMREPDKEDTDVLPEGTAELKLENASFAWPGVEKNVLQGITVSFPIGLTVIYGEVASGKTALLQALLGELDITGGEFVRPEQVVGYCSQTPWLQSMSIRDNILFDCPYEDVRYREVLEACALLPDMAEFKHGDLSNIGEQGIGLSGGQKARVALARAVYSQAKVLFLDDPLSALDHQTAEFIVHKLLAGPLMKDRTTVLVTHRTELCHGLAKQWVELDKERATIHEPTEAEDNALNQMVTHESVDDEEKKKREEEQAAAIPDKFIEDEHRATGGVKLRVYWRYIKAGGAWWIVSIFVMAGFRVLDFGQQWFIKAWGEGYDNGNQSGLFDFLPPPGENVIPWLQFFFVFVTITAVLYWWTVLIMWGVGYHASKSIFREAIDRVAHATFRYYDVTPVGRLMNRLTSDMGTVDGHLSNIILIFAWQMIGWVSCIVVILSSTPAFLVFGIFLVCGFFYNFYRFLPTSQSLRRLEMVSLSPLMSNFGSLVEGLTTVRAFSAQSRFMGKVIEVVDDFQKNDHFYWSLQSWLTFRFSVLSASSTLVMTLIAIYMNITTGLTAFVLVTASKFVMNTDGLCRMYGYLEMDFTSVERVIELLDLETESPGVVEPPAHWPTYSGDIVFEDVTIRYAPNLEPALNNITLKIPAGSSTAVIGRTGSGKSTLALSLLATVVPESGRILIDGVDIATVNRQSLRSRVTFLAQEPVLFSGSMRKNLDPLDEYSDAACESVLSKVAPSTYAWTLSTNIEGGGKGLSQGQRQLVGLARAMLRRSPVLIMDEATASIDFETAQRIQAVLREEMRESTVITIAHRLEAVKNADYCIVLGKGKLVKAGRAEDMLRDGGEYAGMLA